jgi:hypothetical protein
MRNEYLMHTLSALDEITLSTLNTYEELVEEKTARAPHYTSSPGRRDRER